MTGPGTGSVAGLLLAAGAGRRAGGPKALRFDQETSWLVRSLRVLTDGGCDPVIVVLGAEADQARDLLPADPRIRVLVTPEWSAGMSASLRAGLQTIEEDEVDAVVVHLVDLPDVGADVVARVISRTRATGDLRSRLSRARYGERPGHPVLIGVDHLPQLLPTLTGDHGAARYLLDHETYGVQCSDLAGGLDQDLGADPSGDRPQH